MSEEHRIAAPEPGSTIHHYRLIAKRASGGMGDVWEAADLNVESRRVAIKLLPPELVRDPVRRQMFRAEAHLALGITHANVVRVYDLGCEDGFEFLVMELVDGCTLQEILAGGPLPPREAARLGAQIARGMAEAHRQGVVHRDLKPSNILVTPKGEARIIDFGLASLTARVLSTRGSDDPTRARLDSWLDVLHDPSLPVAVNRDLAQGTLPYMSPEQLRGLPVDERTDVFSLGAVLYEMATGKRAFASRNTADLVREVLEARPVPMRELQPRIPPGLERVVSRAMAELARDRFASMEAVAIDLENPQTTHARSAVYWALRRAARLISGNIRRKAVFAVLAAVLAASIAGMPSLLRWRFARAYFHEDFGNPDKSQLLRSGWRLLEPNPDLWNRPDSAGCLTLFTHRADNWCPKELRYPIQDVVTRPFTHSHFVATTCLVGFRPTHPFQQAGLLLLGDEDNYVRLTFAQTGDHLIAQGVFEIRGETSECQIALRPSDHVWLQIERDGDEFALRVRLDEEQRVFTEVCRKKMTFSQSSVALAAFHGINADLPDGNKMPFLWAPLAAHFDALEVVKLR